MGAIILLWRLAQLKLLCQWCR